ncbi:hypothetical protein NQ317_016619 [Molorchus minor]|uniref:Uncharacterized protein n=1 Tax=Molorchus minor TaxID=1323400 RepID=A0ABQ9IRZ7_9CUCU|nr:hypothetical protein NQ317_016619 [Molorchus minor]
MGMASATISPSFTILEIPDGQKNSNRENSHRESTRLRISTARNIPHKKPSVCAISRYCTPRPTEERSRKPEIAIETLKTKLTTTTHKKEVNSPKIRPNSVQVNSNEKAYQMIDYRLIKSPTLRRKVYSANLVARVSSPHSPTTEINNQIGMLSMKNHLPKEEEISKRYAHPETPHAGKRNIPEAINAVRNLSVNVGKQSVIVGQPHR